MVKNSSEPGTLALLRRESLASATQAEIEKLILSGAYAPGAKLGEEELAERLGVSRGPVREAFRGLEELGLIRFEKNRGVFVRKVSIDEANQSYVVRGALEGLAGRIVAEKISADETKLLQSIVKRMERAIARRHYSEYVDLNYEFHGTIVGLTDNAKLIHVYRAIANELLLFRNESRAPGETLDEHRAIVDKIVAHDADAAAAALHDHIDGGRRRMLEAYGRAASAGADGAESEGA